jgi:hypothetical protein
LTSSGFKYENESSGDDHDDDDDENSVIIENDHGFTVQQLSSAAAHLPQSLNNKTIISINKNNKSNLSNNNKNIYNITTQMTDNELPSNEYDNNILVTKSMHLGSSSSYAKCITTENLAASSSSSRFNSSSMTINEQTGVHGVATNMSASSSSLLLNHQRSNNPPAFVVNLTAIYRLLYFVRSFFSSGQITVTTVFLPTF